MTIHSGDKVYPKTCHPYLGSMDIGDPQSLNRCSYARNNPVTFVDPLGLDNCAFNVQLNNNAGLSTADITTIQTRINSIFGAVASPNGDTVGVNFSFKGKPDTTLTLTPDAPWYVNLYGNYPTGSESRFVDPKVYTNNVGGGPGSDMPNWASAIGGIGAHELGHYFLSTGEQAFSTKGTNVMMFSNAPTDQRGGPIDRQSAFENLSSPLWKFTPDQVSKLYQTCAKDRKQRASSGGGGGGGSNGDLYGFATWECDGVYCYVHVWSIFKRRY